jgi:hypothetical protein
LSEPAGEKIADKARKAPVSVRERMNERTNSSAAKMTSTGIAFPFALGIIARSAVIWGAYRAERSTAMTPAIDPR